MRKVCDSILSCNQEKTILFEKNGYKIFGCNKCGQRFSEIEDAENHVAQVYSDDYFFEGKAGYPNYLNEKELLYNYGKRYAKIVSKYIKTGKVLDTGCAAGFILKGFIDSGWSGVGIEPNNTMANYGRNEMNLNITTGSLETYESTEKFDLINLIQVIGHFYDLDKAIFKIRQLLNKNGFVLVESWNMKSGIAKLMGKNWHEYSPPSVVHWFSDDTLSDLFDQYGFELVAKGYPPKKINIEHAISLIEEKSFNFLFKKRIFAFLNKLFGKYNLNYPPLDLKWYLFQLKDR
jgi:2-polyprenyl-3-methyl-5-hydroxy-6-metoxy-1,4-benzoquinol methylase